MAVASTIRKTTAGLMVMLLSMTFTGRASAQSGLQPTDPFTPAQLSPSLLDFVTGKPVATNCKSLFTNPLLREAFAGQPLDSAKGLAAAIKAEKLDAKNRKKAVKFLGTVDCVTYPDAPKVLVTVLQTDRVEPVRFEAAKALREMLNRGESLREKFCKFFGKTRKTRRAEACKGCCSDEILNALSRIAYESDEQGCPIEPSYRVRKMAIKAMNECPCYACPTTYVDQTQEGVEIPVVPPPSEDVDSGEPMEEIEQGPDVNGNEASFSPVAPRGLQVVPTEIPVRLTTEIDTQFFDEQYSGSVVIEKANHDADMVGNSVVRIDSKSLGVLSNFCVVGLYEGKFENANSQFSSVYQGRKYTFASETARREFDSQPQLYAPAYSGYDPVIARNNGEAVEGRILRRFEGRLYTFSSKGNWREFQANPQRYMAKD